MVWLIVFSVLAVAFSYMLAVIIDAVARLIAANPNTVPSIKDVVDSVGVTPWPCAAVWAVVGEVSGISVLGIACIADLRGVRKFVTALGGVVWLAAWVFGGGLACAAIMMCLGLLLAHPSDPVPVPLLVTSAVTGLLALVLARLLPRVRAASAGAFAPPERSHW